MKKKSRRIEIVERLLKLQYFYKGDEIDFFNSTVMGEIRESMITEEENNDLLIHDLKVKKLLRDNNITTQDDDDE